MTKLSGSSYRRLPVILGALLLLAFVVRLLALVGLKGTIYYDFPLYDEQVYHAIAEKMVEGTYESSAVYEYSPLPIYLMALVYKLFSPDIAHIRVMNVFLGVAACGVFYLVGKEMAGRRVGLLSCLVAALYKPLIFYSAVPLKTSLAVLLFALVIWLLLLALKKPGPIVVLLLGMMAGLLLNVRPNAVLLAPLLPLLVLWGVYRGGYSRKVFCTTLGLYLCGLALSLSPFIVRNYLVAGRLALTTTQTGQILYYGNNLESPDPYYKPLPFATSAPKVQGVQFTIEASRRTGKTLSHQEASRYWTREVIRMCWENPLAYAKKLSLKILALFNRFEFGDHYHVGFMERFVPFLGLPFLPFWMILPLGMAGMLTSLRGSGKFPSLALVFLVYSSTLVVFFTGTRLRLPLLVLLIPFAVIGSLRVLEAVRARRTREVRGCLLLAAAFFVVQFLPIPGAGDMSAYYNTHALILRAQGRLDEAVPYWEQSSRLREPFSAYANLSLANTWMRRGDRNRAKAYLYEIPDDSFAAAHKHNLLGDLLAAEGKLDRAIKAYRQSLQINSGYLATRTKLIRVLRTVDPRRAAAESEEYERINAFYNLY